MTAIVYQIINIFIGGMILAVLLLGYMFWQRYKNQKEAEGKMLCHFFTQGGSHYYALCREDKGKVEAPEGHDVGEYFIIPSSKFMGRWKPNQPKFMQVGVPTTAFMENQREPLPSTKPQEWIKSPEKHRITAFMQQIAVNESAMKTAMAMQSGVWKDIASMAQFIRHVPIMFYICLALLGGMLLLGYFSYMTYAVVSSLRVGG